MAIPTRPSGANTPSPNPSLTPEPPVDPLGPAAGEAARDTPPWSDSGFASEADTTPMSSASMESTSGPRDFARFVRDQASSQLENQKERATRGLGNVAQAVRHTTDRMREAGHEGFASYVQQAADQLDGFARGLQNKSLDEVVKDVQLFARRHPALFIGGAFGLGLLGGRFLKSSRDKVRVADRYGSEWSDYGTTTPSSRSERQMPSGI